MVSGKRSERNIRRIALLIEYDGSQFCGMQYQRNSSSVQGELENALHVLYGYEIRISSSGRTDTGVHAIGQVVHYDDYGELSLGRILTGLNGITNRAVSIRNAYLVSCDFHSRFHAISREYLYKIYNNPVPSPFINNRAMWMPKYCDTDFIKEFCSYLIGEHDFKSFCKTVSAEKPTVRTISEINVTKHDDLIQLKIKGRSFLHNMIRIIVGTIDYFNKNSIKPSKIVDILDARDRKAAGPTASASGLYLAKIEYKPSLDSYPSVF